MNNIFEAVTGLVAVGLLFWNISTEFHHFIQTLLVIAFILGFASLLIGIVYKTIKKEQPSSTFGTFSSAPRPNSELNRKTNIIVVAFLVILFAGATFYLVLLISTVP